VPEGDTLHRIAAGLRPFLVGRAVTAATARRPGPRAELLVGATIESVESAGKNLIVRFDNGLALRTHLGMHGSWHRYSPGERWLRSPARARLVLEVPGAVAVCFDAPTVELFETRAEPVHRTLAALGPDLLDPGFGEADLAEAVLRLRGSDVETIAEGLLDQRSLAGIGNVYKSEALFAERIDPFAPVVTLDDATLRRLVGTARAMLLANLESGPRVTTSAVPEEARRIGRSWVYGRAGRPCRRCGSVIESLRHGRNNRTTYWCPACQERAGAQPG
jgi:endonuclease VIII